MTIQVLQKESRNGRVDTKQNRIEGKNNFKGQKEDVTKQAEFTKKFQ